MAARKLLNPPIIEPGTPPPFNCDDNCRDNCTVDCYKLCNPFCLIAPINDDSPSPIPPIMVDSDEHDIPLFKVHHGISKAITISLVVASVLVFMLACISVYKLCNERYNRRRRMRSLLLVEEERPERDGNRDMDRDEFMDEVQGPNQTVEHHIWYIRTIGLDPAVISKIAVVKYKKGEGLIEGTDCSVCLSEFEEGETLRLLPKCNHAFHLPCIDTWLAAHTNCPMCRAGVVNNSAVLASEEGLVHDSGLVEEEIRAEVSVGTDEVVERSDVVVGIDNDADDDVNSSSQVAVRRSVSMDHISAARLALAVNNAQRAQSGDDDQVSEMKELDDAAIVPKGNGINQRLLRLVGSLSIDRPACIKRSLSCNANV